MNWSAVRRRLAEEIENAFGELGTTSVRLLAERAQVRYTTLARFLLYRGLKQTEHLQQRTVVSVCQALNLSPVWLLDGEGAKQLGLWPVLVTRVDESHKPDIVDGLRRVLDFASQIPDELTRARVCRAIAAGCIDVSVNEGIAVPVDVYDILVATDTILVGAGLRMQA